jgi:Arginyl-tRNA synthetase
LGKIKELEGEDKNKRIEREKILFRRTIKGDEKDGAFKKLDNRWTYFGGDDAYYENKINRKYDVLINNKGADQAGEKKRNNTAVEALSGKKNKGICKGRQIVKVIKDGKPFKMSKRKGDYITVEELNNEVGKDATRLIMLKRSSDGELDMNFTKEKEKYKEKPL